jgi:hypothetical protein
MITPNKFINYKRSIVGKLEHVLIELNNEESVFDLYHKCSKHFDNVDDFILAIDTLYILDKIEIDLKTGIVKKC